MPQRTPFLLVGLLAAFTVATAWGATLASVESPSIPLVGVAPPSDRIGGARPSPSAEMRLHRAQVFAAPFVIADPTDRSLRLIHNDGLLVAWALMEQAAPSPEPEAGSGDGSTSGYMGSLGSGMRAGLVVGSVTSAWGHAPSGRTRIGSAPAGFAEALRTTLGIEVGLKRDGVIDGRPAIVTDIQAPQPETHIHLGSTMTGMVGNEGILVSLPARIWILDVGGTTVLIQVWGRTDGDLRAFLPDATALLETIEFEAP